jgi:hypothetical protein
MTSSSIVLVIPFEMKEEAKLRKCSWNKENKYWFISSDRYNEDDKFFETYKRVDLNSTYENKDEIKSNNGKWDPENKVWYTFKANEKLQKYMKFNDKNEVQITTAEKKEKHKKEKKSKQIKQETEDDVIDENGFCKYCGWNSCYLDSHIIHGNFKCKFITDNYDVSIDEDGEIEYKKKYPLPTGG